MTNPLVSVHMITFNHAPYIAEAIDGVLMQKCGFPFELVIGEDCSSDGTRDIVLAYERRYPKIVRVVRSDRNIGGVMNWHRIMHACCGKYIAYCEGDDYWIDPLKLQKQVELLEGHAEYGFVFGDVQLLYEATGVITRHAFRRFRLWEKTPDDLGLAILLNEYPMVSGVTCTMCVRRDLALHVIENNPLEFRTNRFLFLDRTFWLELARLTRFKYVDEEWGTYRIQYESASKSQSPGKMLRFCTSVKDVNLHYCHKYAYPPAVYRQLVRDSNQVLLWFSFLAGDFRRAREILRENREHGIPRTTRDLCLRIGAECRYLGPVVNSTMCFIRRALNHAKRWASTRPWCLRIYRCCTGKAPILRTRTDPQTANSRP